MYLNTPPQDNISHVHSPELLKKMMWLLYTECVLGCANPLWFVVSNSSVKQLLFQTDVVPSYSTVPLKQNCCCMNHDVHAFLGLFAVVVVTASMVVACMMSSSLYLFIVLMYSV